jgi:hypothetical protein
MTLKGLQMSKKSSPEKERRKTTSRRRAAHQVTSEGALQFIRNMQKAFPKAPRTKKDKDRLRKYLAKFRDGVLKAVGRRLQADLMQRPPVTIRGKDFKKPRPSESVSRGKQA